MKILRTPDECFENLPDYPFSPNYSEVAGLRIHYVDEGPSDGEVVLLMHGEPTWSYLYRRMIPPLAQAGFRVIAPDLVGCGKSDKLAERTAYSYKNHVAWITGFVKNLNLKSMTLFCQDWGSLIGLRVAAENSDLFKRIVVGNGGLPTGEHPLPVVFHLWKFFSKFSPFFNAGRIVNFACVNKLEPKVIAAYNAPFPSNAYKQAIRIFPSLVPANRRDPASSDNMRAWDVYRKWEKPFLTAYSDRDPITRGAERLFQSRVPGAQGQPHTIIKGAGHFLQEEKGEELAKVIIDFIRNVDKNPDH